MNIVEVIPLSRAKVPEKLAYFTASETPVGSVVSVPLRSKSIHALVASVRPAEDLKLEIKKAPYEIRKLKKLKTINFFPATFMESAKKLSDYYCGSMGAIIEALSAESLLQNAGKVPAAETPQGRNLSRKLKREKVTIAVQGNDEDRYSAWRSLIRQEFAHKRSLVFYVPTIEDAENLSSTLGKGVEKYVYMLHASLPPKKILETWKNIAASDHAVAVVATAAFAALPRSDIESVIVERENGRGWISPKTPYLDFRRAIETLAHDNGQAVYLSDIILRLETLSRVENGQATEGSPFKSRSVSLAEDIFVDMKKTNSLAKTTENKKGKFRVISPELEKFLRLAREENDSVFLYTLRRGHSTMTVCDDCETVASCNRCGKPVVLYASRQGNFFMCQLCGEKRAADEACANCGGPWLSALGIGIDRVEEELKNIFGKTDIFKIDADSTTSEKQMSDTLAAFRSKPGSILLGTELALSRLRESVDFGAAISLDSLFSLPDFRISEKAMYTLCRLRALCRKRFLLQTRRPEEKVFGYASKGNIADFVRETIADRKHFGYPPFTTLVKITAEGEKNRIAKEMAAVREMAEPFDLEIFPAFTKSPRGKALIHGLLRFDTGLWPSSELVAKLRNLPANISIRVDPETLL